MMALRTYSIKLTGTDGGPLNTIKVCIAGKDITMTSTENDVTWINKGTELDTNNPVLVFFSMYAINGTTWDIEINVSASDQPSYRETGITGEKLLSQGNNRVANYSERRVEINC